MVRRLNNPIIATLIKTARSAKIVTKFALISAQERYKRELPLRFLCFMQVTPRQNALRMSTKFNIRSAFYFRSNKLDIVVAPSLRAKREKQTKKRAKKITSFESLYIFLASNFCTTWLSVCTNGENDV